MSGEIEVLKASDIAPGAYAEGEIKYSEELTYDLYNLTVFDAHAVDIKAFQNNEEEYLKQRASDATQIMLSKLFDLPFEDSEAGPVAKLPSEITTLPREKPIPMPKEKTKWEKFAEEKGIKKNKKRSRMVLDEDTQEWAPRWGYQRGNEGIASHPIIEVKPGEDPMEDPWSKEKKMKKERVKDNIQKMLRNQGITKEAQQPKIGIPIDLASHPSKVGKRGKEGTKKALEHVQHSTASLGKFDEKRRDEPERKRTAIKRKFTPVADKTALENERTRASKVVENILRKSDPSIKTKKHVNLDALEPEDRFKKKKGRGGAGKMKKVTKKRAGNKK